MFGLCGQPLPNRQGLLFPFLPISGFSQPPLSEWRRNQLSLAWGWLLSPDSFTTGSHGPNRAGLLLRWCRFPTWLSKPHTAAHGGEFGFSPQNELTPPPKGGGAEYHLSWVCWVCPARSQPGHAGPTGLVWGFAGVVPLPGSQNRTQALTGPSLVFTVFFSHLFSSVIPLVAAPGDNSPHREWEGSCKAASRFSRFRPMSTPLSAAFR